MNNSCDYQEFKNDNEYEYTVEVNFLGNETLLEVLKDYVITKIKPLQQK